ncbi:hypothetical protein AAFF_G00385260 [Aldrovandia affinis]|uniref:Uncharacterized protein n=1 Tax=Aldrovandia affinis TaxID=143900 RepID=A0AAD7WLN6_9TELE|nr:hypothetical protein AAFF_G00385260 [Aldrovandia affinis]
MKSCRACILQQNLQAEPQRCLQPPTLSGATELTADLPVVGGVGRRFDMAPDCNVTTKSVGPFRGSLELWVLLAVISTVLVLTVCWNILCCIAKYCTDRGKRFLPRFRRSLSLRLKDMEDNPIYGNISYTQNRVDLPSATNAAGETQKMKAASQVSYKRQDCYANLQLKVPKPASGRSSPQIQYSDVVTLPRAQAGAELGEEPAVEADSTSLQSDLYASVESQRNKALANNESYANHV